MSSYVHYHLLTDVSYTSFCDVNTTMNCTQAYLSRYGSLWGIPVGDRRRDLFFALVLLVAGVAAGRPASPGRETAPAYVFALSTIGLAVVLYLGWASYFVLRRSVFSARSPTSSVIAIFIISGGATLVSHDHTARSRAPRRPHARVRVPLALLLTAVFVGAPVTAIAAFPREAAPRHRAAGAGARCRRCRPRSAPSSPSGGTCSPRSSVPISSDGAKVLIVKFNDYQCPACRMTHDAYKPRPRQARGVRAGEVRREALCARTGVQPERAERQPLRLVRGGRGRGDGQGQRDVGKARGLDLRASSVRRSLTPDQVKDAARNGRRHHRFRRAVSATVEQLKTDGGLGKLLDVNSTPTFFINGRMPPTNQILAPQYFDALIELELQRAQILKIARHAPGDTHRRPDEGLRDRLLAQEAVSRARSPVRSRSRRARSSGSSDRTAQERRRR